MNVQQDDIPMLGKINKSQVPPIDNKRILAFVNTFIINTVTFLNTFAVNCETKFIDFETKLQKVEASVLIIEGKLSSIPDTDDEAVIVNENKNIPIKETEKIDENDSANIADTQNNVINEDLNPTSEDQHNNDEETSVEPTINGIKACEDDRYRKYFKMLQFGVPNQAVKIKMESEGCDSSILDYPNKIL